MTKTYLINGKEYGAGDPVPWDDAIEHSGFYFSRAKYFNLPLPPACFVANEDLDSFEKLSEHEQELIGKYHTMFDDAEIEATHRLMENDGNFD